MRGLVRFTLRQQVLFNLLFVLMIVAGAFSLAALPMERYPEINFGKVIVTTVYPGASPRDVEALVTREIELALDGLENVELVRATSVRERSTIIVKFRDDADSDALYNELRFRVLSMLERLPDGVDPPHFDLVRTSFWLPVVTVNLIGDRSNRALSLIAKELQIRMAQIPGVSEAKLDGEQRREFHVFLDPWKLKSHGVSYDQVAAALQDANVTLPAGDFSDGSGEYVIRVDERFRSREQVVDTLIRRDADGSFVTLADLVSDARLGYRAPSIVTSANGRDGVALRLLKAKGGNAMEIYAAVEAVIAELAPTLDQEGVAVVLTQDSTTYIGESIQTLGWNLLVGILLVSLILWYFMGLRNAGIVTVGIPFSFMVTMVLMQLTGNSLNEITLFSFVLVSGIIVDDAIVVVENIYRRAQEGEPIEQAIVEGTAEVAWPVISATATTVAAFLPMLIMTGSTGQFFALIPKAVSFAILASLIECLFILPLHYLDFGPRPVSTGDGAAHLERDNLLMRALRRMTDWLIRATIRFRLLSLTVVLVTFAAAVAILGVSVAGIAPLMRIQFFPDDYSTYYVFVEGPPETPIEETHHRVKAIAGFIMNDGPGYARSAAGFAGFTVSEDYEDEMGRHLGTVMVALPRKSEQAFDDPLAHLERMRERLIERFAGHGFRIRVRAEKDGPPTGKDINVQIAGSSETAVRALSAALLERLGHHPEFGPHLLDLQDDRGIPARVFRLTVDESRARELGLTPGDAARMAASVLDGRYIGKYRLSDEEVDLKLRVDPAYLDAPEAALDIPVWEHPSGPVLLRDIVRPVAEIQPGELRRYQRQRSLTITANIRPGAPVSAAQVNAWVRAQYRELRAGHPGATLVFGGEYEETQRSFDSLAKAFGLAVLLIYLILATQFRSYSQPLIILSAVMFSIIGVVFGKVVTQSLFTINSFIAVVGVTGVVVNDSLVLLDFINRRYRAGAGRREAIREGVHLRLRPIVLTTLTTTLGLLPMAIGIPSYSVIWGTMASTFVTGLATATFLTLFIVPVAWDLLMERDEKRNARRRLRVGRAASKQ
ncbi:MAG: efflux RND transporter permease subunit [Thiocapsa sp.]|nr:efflux RND transporter permease subunit [Thiocapsa sp.]MCG6983612.1 efflux RND transporter permease subunit [Thiocapsa sp.]